MPTLVDDNNTAIIWLVHEDGVLGCEFLTLIKINKAYSLHNYVKLVNSVDLVSSIEIITHNENETCL